MKPFGEHCLSYRSGYTVELCLSHLEGLLDAERERKRGQGKYRERMGLIEDAVEKLNRAVDMGEDA